MRILVIFHWFVFSLSTFQIIALESIMNTRDRESSSETKSSVELLEDPEFKLFIDTFNEHYDAISHLALSEQRKLDAEFILKQTHCYEKVFHTVNLEVSGVENNKIPLRVYVPRDSTDLPVIMYFHGGGWVFGGIEEADAVCRRLANHLGCIIASVGYRLAPESPFPKPLEDCYAATEWMVNNAHLFGGNSQNVIVSGESAGGNLAAAVALMARDKQGPKLAAQLLLYPVISSTIRDDIYDSCPDHYFLTKDSMKFFWNMYAQYSGQDKNPYASLDCGIEFSKLPPALIITAEYDPLSFDADRYAIRLRQAGVTVVKKAFAKLIHGFLYIPLYNEERKVRWTREIRDSLHELRIL